MEERGLSYFSKAIATILIKRGRKHLIGDAHGSSIFASSLTNNLTCANHLPVIHCSHSFCCYRYFQTKCKGRVRTIDGKVVGIPADHSHLPNNNDEFKWQIRNELKAAAIEHPSLSRKAIVSKELRKSQSSLATSSLPTMKSMMELVSRVRRKEGGSVFKSLEEISISNELKMFTKSEHFLLFDSGPNRHERIIVFGARQCAQFLHRSEHIFIDGTFDSAPKLFKQMVSVHGACMNSSHDLSSFNSIHKIVKSISLTQIISISFRSQNRRNLLSCDICSRRKKVFWNVQANTPSGKNCAWLRMYTKTCDS